MTETHTVVCDTCKRDITTTGNSIDWRLAVVNQPIPGYGEGAYTDMVIYPVTKQDTNYCSWPCFARSELVDKAIATREREASS